MSTEDNNHHYHNHRITEVSIDVSTEALPNNLREEPTESAPLLKSPVFVPVEKEAAKRAWRKMHKSHGLTPSHSGYSAPSITNPFRQHDSQHPFASHSTSEALFVNVTSNTIRKQLATMANELYHQNRNSQNELADRVSNHELLSGLLFPGEEIISIPPMLVSEVHFEDHDVFKVVAIQTTYRLIFMKVDGANVCMFNRSENREIFLRETYVITNSLFDGIWYYPIPMRSLTGLSFEIKSESSVYRKLESRRPWWALFLCMVGGLLGFLYFVPPAEGVSILFIITPIMVSLILIGALLFLVLKSYVKGSSAWSHSAKTRIVKLGYKDPLSQKATVATCILEPAYPLQDLKYFVAMLQRNATQMSGIVQTSE